MFHVKHLITIQKGFSKYSQQKTEGCLLVWKEYNII